MTQTPQQLFEAAAARVSRDGVPVTLTGYHAFGPTLSAGRFALPNGLKIVLVPDHRAPIFAYQTWFKVGSKHEDPERTGIAHLFEHLMFKGTKRFATGTFDAEMERRGAQTNAATWVDWTYYMEALAARGDNLATVIDFEADRMTGLVLDRETFLSELEVVKNERRMSVEDSLSGLLGEQLLALAYTTHPYRWPTIGSMAHLEAASLTELERFYRAFYAPNNATVVLVGDVEPEAALRELVRGYGKLEAQAIDPRPWTPEPPQTAARERTVRRPMVAPQLVIGYHAPAQGTAPYAACEMLTEALVSGDTARLYERLVTREGLASEVGGFLSPFAEPGLFELHVTARPDADPRACLRVVQEELDALPRGLTKNELDKARNGLELSLIDTLKDVEGCAEALGHHETNFGDFGRAFAAGAQYAAVTPADLAATAASVFQVTNRSVVIGVPAAAGEEH
ncbi:MAG TPA: pitrilysin family protein [Myxococcota bacterium]|nr:pitrilysin family protein [Myxococcota bacterium]